MGYDDNGIPTEQLVEKETGVNSRQISRQEFWDLCLETNEKFRASYKQQRMDYGFSCDRKQTYATITPEVQQIAQQRFVQMVRQ
jgi:valyl-tRNA synthetase